MRGYIHIVPIVACLFTGVIASAQGEEDIYFQVGVDDGEQYLKDYLRPVFNGIGYGFTGGWYNTAETHKQWGFDIVVSTSVAFVPKDDLSFKFDNSDYERLRVASGTAQLSTAFGPQNKADRPELIVINEDEEELVRFTSPPGAINMKSKVGFNAIPMPMYQVGFGLIKNTDLKLRILPKINVGDGSVSMFGIGFQHDIARWFKVMQWQDVSFSALGAFNNLTLKYDLDYDSPTTSGNMSVVKLNGFTLQAIASKEYYNVITIFGGLGYSRAGSRLQILGVYPANEINYQLPDDPIDFRYGQSSFNVSMGLTLKLFFINASIAHSIQQYQVTTASLGITIR